MATPHWTDALTEAGACTSAVAWAKNYTHLDAAWMACNHANWLLWWLGHNLPDTQAHRETLTCIAIRIVLNIPTRKPIEGWDSWAHMYFTGTNRGAEAARAAEEAAMRAVQAAEATMRVARAVRAVGVAVQAARAAWAAVQATEAVRAVGVAVQAAEVAEAAMRAVRAVGVAVQATEVAVQATEVAGAAEIVREYYPLPPRKEA